MPIQVTRDERTGRIKIVIAGRFQGLDTESPPMNLLPEHFPGIQNMNLPGGIPVRMDGFALHDTTMTLATTPTLLARRTPTSGTAEYVGATEGGQVYVWDAAGNSWISLRRGLSTTAGLWWSHTQIADYLVIANPTDGIYKYDGTRLIPLGAKYIADMESDESTWAGSGSFDTTTVREGLRSRLLTSTGAAVTSTLTPATAWNLIDGLLEAKDYNTTTDRISFYVNIDNTANLDTTNTFIRFGDVADANYFQLPASAWGTLANGWNLIRIARSSFTTTGAPVWSNLAKMTLSVDATGATTVNVYWDDVYTIYAAVSVMPAVQIVTTWKNMVLGARSDAEPSTVFYSRVSGPDEFDELASIPIQEADGDETTGLHPYYNQVFVTKDNTCHSISGSVAGTIYPNYNLETILVTTEHGGSSHRALAEAVGRIYVWWRGEIHRYNGTGTEKVSKKIDPTLATVNMARLPYVVGARRRVLNQIFWYYSDGSDSTNQDGIRYDFIEDAFLPTEGQSMALAEQVFDADVEYLLTAEYDGDIMRQDSGSDFAGTAITSFVTLQWLSAQSPDEVKIWEEVFVPYQTNTGSLIVEYRVASHPREFDAAAYTTAGTIDMAVTGELGRVFIGERSRWIQIRLRTVGAAWTQYVPIVVTAFPTGAMF